MAQLWRVCYLGYRVLRTLRIVRCRRSFFVLPQTTRGPERGIRLGGERARTAERWGTIMSRENLGSKRTRGSKVVPVLGAAGLSLSLAGGASAAGAQVADALTHKAVVSHEIMLGEEQIADVSLATFYVFDKENAGPSQRSESWRVAAGRALNYTSGNDAYPTPLRPVTQPHGARAEARSEKPAASTIRLSHPLSTRQYPALIEASR